MGYIYHMDMPRIAMYVWRFHPFAGGAEKQCRILSGELAKKGIPVFIVTERIKKTKRFEIIDGVEVFRVSSFNWLRNIPYYIKKFLNIFKKAKEKSDALLYADAKRGLLKTISVFLTYTLPNYCFFIASLWVFYKKRRDFDILHVHEAHWIAAFGVKIAHMLHKKVIVKEAISGDVMTFKEQSPFSQNKAMAADIFIAISDEIFSNLVSIGIDRKRIRKIPNGINIDSSVWQYSSSKERSAVCVSKFNQLPNKGIDVLLLAWKILAQRHNEQTTLRIYGKGDSHLFKKLAINLNIERYVSFSSFKDDARTYLLNSSIFILSSRAEGMSNALLEAMSLGMPCVATDISGNRDLIKHGIDGLLAPSENPEALAGALLFMLDNPDKAIMMGRNARKTIEEGYAISIIADKYINLYKDLVVKQKVNKCAA